MKRRYASALRTEQAEDTRNRILAALTQQLATAPDDFSLAQVAEQAGVSLRTLHHHFPDADSRVAALAQWIDAQVGLSQDTGPSSLDDIGPFARRMAEAFFSNEKLLRAQMASGVASQVRRRRRKKREEQLRGVLESAVKDARSAALVTAAVTWLIGADTAAALKDRFGLSNDEVTRTMEWVARLLTQGAARGDLP